MSTPPLPPNNSNRTMKTVSASIALVLTASLWAHSSTAQEVVPAPEARPSPMAVAQATLDDGTYISIRYSSPRKRGREVFGGLEAFGQVWRFGANEATEMTVTQDVLFGGRPLEAGTYALFAIPNPTEWTLIVNDNLGQWGAFSYDEEADVMRIDVPSEHTDRIFEAFTISLDTSGGGSSAILHAVWDQTRISLPIETIETTP